MPKVSVITPVHNRPAYLEEAVESIQQQSFTDWEHIIIDDGSDNPETGKVLARIANLPKISIYRTENKGLSGARNFGIGKSAGEYILTLDDDDKWHADFIDAALVIFEEKKQAGVVTAWLKEFGHSNRIVKTEGGGEKNFLVENNSAHAMFKKEHWEKVGGYDERMKTGYEDWDFWLRITAMGHQVEVVEQPFFLYRVHRGLSLYKEARSIHLSLFRYIVEKNEKIYREYMVDALCLLEEKVMDKENALESGGLLSRLKRILYQ